MKTRSRLVLALACAAALPAALPAALAYAAQPAGPPVAPAVAGQPAQVAPARSPTPPVPPLRLEEGRPIETRGPELDTDKPAFAGQNAAPYRKTVTPVVTVVTDKLDRPWSLAFLSGGRMLITEKPGKLRIVSPTGAISEPITGLPPINFQGQVGLLEVVLDNNYARNKRIFFSFSETVQPGDNTRIALARATLDEARLALTDVKIIWRNSTEMPRNPNSANQGGKMAMGRDGYLYMMVGDRSLSPPWLVAQRLDTALGKTIRITVDGAPAPGNPYVNVSGALPEIWTLGHRSPQGLAFDSRGRLWQSEHGPRGGDELNILEKGKNYGWPVIVHGIDYPGEKINGGKTEQEGMEQPRYYWDPVIATSGLAFYRGNLFPQWKNSVFVGALGRQMLDRLELDSTGTKVIAEEPLLLDQKSRVREVRVDTAGAVFVLTDNGRLLKLTPP